MKVAYSATIWDSGRSGIGNYIAEQLRLLASRSDLDLSVLEFGGKVLQGTGTPGKGSSGDGISRILAPVRDILWHRSGLERLSQRNAFDVVHVPTIRRLPGTLPCSSVVTVHDLGPVRVASKYGMLRNIYHRKVIPSWLKRIDAIVTPSENTRNDLVELYNADPSKIHVVPNGIDHGTYSVGNKDESRAVIEGEGIERPYFVYLSRLEHPAKNHVNLIKAFRKFKEATGAPHQLLCIGGEWNGVEAIYEEASDLKESGDIVFPGWVDKALLPHYLRAAEALVYPSLFEGFGLPVIEAMACGTPVACSRSSSLTEIAEGHAMLFDPHQPDEIQDCLTQLASDGDLRDRLSATGLAHAASFTWERSVEETVAVWKKVAG